MSDAREAAGRLLSIMGLALICAACAAEPTASPSPAQCRLPTVLTPAPERQAPAHEVSRGVPTAYYLLALSWSPEWCRGRGDDPDNALQCRQNDFGFVVHGLWPSGTGGRHPRFCAAAPPLDVATLRRSLCMTPSPELLQHEWAAHGTCGWESPAAYFAQAAALWDAIEPPELAGRSMTAGQVRDTFVHANPQLFRDAIQVRVGGGNRLREVAVCYSQSFRPIACPSGGGTPDRVTVRVTPRRSELGDGW